MKQELIVTGATVKEALENGASKLGVMPSELKYEVLVEPKKGVFLGIGRVEAKLKVTYVSDPTVTALEFVNLLLDGMDIGASAKGEEGPDGEFLIRISGENAGALIGYHGETMDALQYLVNLAANKKTDETDERNYRRILIDVEDYRERRAETLRALARRTAQRVLKYKKNIALDPMTPYERRIIHSEVQNIKGVTTYSVGVDNNRKVIVALEEKNKNG